jgi:hypothetical protein
VGASCCEGTVPPPSAIPGADSQHTASVSARSIHEHFGFRTADTQNRPAIDRQPSMTGTRPRWRTATGIRAGSSEMPVEPLRYATACVSLKQPDKQKRASYLATKSARRTDDCAELCSLCRHREPRLGLVLCRKFPNVVSLTSTITRMIVPVKANGVLYRSETGEQVSQPMSSCSSGGPLRRSSAC